MVNEQRLLDSFLRMVQIDSISKRERSFADYLKEQLESLGIKVIEDDCGVKIGGNSGNIVGTLSGEQGKAAIAFAAHMDTVVPGEGIKPIFRDGIIYSDGTTILGSDDKAAIASMLEAVTILREKNISHGKLQFIFTVGEEIGLQGAQNIDKSLLSSDMCFVLDASGEVGTIINQAPTQYQVDITVHGRAAHAGMSPQDGVNAIQVGSRALARIPLGRIDEETTANIGLINGGKATNIVPDRLELQGEVRSLDPLKLKKVLTKIERTFKTVTTKYGAKADISFKEIYKGFKLNEDEEVIRITLDAMRKIQKEPILKPTGGGSDANVFNQDGIPSVVLGIGMNKVHTLEENIKLSEMVDMVNFIINVITECR